MYSGVPERNAPSDGSLCNMGGESGIPPGDVGGLYSFQLPLYGECDSEHGRPDQTDPAFCESIVAGLSGIADQPGPYATQKTALVQSAVFCSFRCFRGHERPTLLSLCDRDAPCGGAAVRLLF